jgi:hypothetical protein
VGVREAGGGKEVLSDVGGRPSIAGLVAAVIALVMLVVYLMLIAAEDEDDWGIVAVFAVLIGASGLAAGVGSVLAYGPARTGLLSGAAATLIVVGVLGIFSIGLPLLVAGWLAVGAAIRSGAEAAG